METGSTIDLMYSIVLQLHSILRWLVILAGVWAVVSVLPSRHRFGRPVPPLPGLLFSILLDVQMLAGLVLYVALSPVTTAAMRDMGAAVQNGAWRFWAIEHPIAMMLAVVFAHLGRPRRGSREANPRALIWFALALLLLLAATPWPFMPQGRPWVRW
jgi:hypothetical protein